MKKLNIDFIRKSAEENGCILISTEYKNSLHLLKFKHLKCNRIFEKNWKEFRRYKDKCVICNKESMKISKRKYQPYDILQLFTNLSDSQDYEIININNYKIATTKLKFRHLKCNKIFNMSWNDFQQGHRCRHCIYKENGKLKRSTEDNVKEFFKSERPDLDFIKLYHTNNKCMIIYIHKHCGRQNNSSLSAIKNGVECKFCRTSKAERTIDYYLSSKNIYFQREVKFSECRNKKMLPFDFLIQLENGFQFLIEYDGLHHFENVFGEDAFEKVKLHDSIKNQFVNSTLKIPLIRISYKYFNSLKLILDEILIIVQRLKIDNEDYIFYLE